MSRLNKKIIIWLSIIAAICLFGWGCLDSRVIHWENTPITGTVLGTVHYPSQHSASRIDIRIKLDSGDVIFVRGGGEMPVIVRGKKVKLNRGITDSGEKFYRFASNPNN